MPIERLDTIEPGTVLEADLVIVGGGPAGLTIARELAGTALRVIVLESGPMEQDAAHEALNRVESRADPTGDAQRAKRIAFHGASAALWSADVQAFGVRCRALGGATAAWAGKSAPFDALDFQPRSWVPHSGWPFDRAHLDPYLDRAAEVLNLGPTCADDAFWSQAGTPPAAPRFDAERLRDFFWQFSRSRIDGMEVMRFGREYGAITAPHVRVLLGATVTAIETEAGGRAVTGVHVSTLAGARTTVRARTVVLAASGIENPRLLLAARQGDPRGLGNAHDQVGRFLMDHPGARIGRFTAAEAAVVTKRFGFYGLKHRGHAHMYMHGLSLSPQLQQREGLLNGAVYMLEDRAPDDPWDALKRLIKGRSATPLADVLAVAASPGLLAKGLGMKAFESNAMPAALKTAVINAMIRTNPNFVVRTYQSRGLPHKLQGLSIDAIVEQAPDPDSRITLSDAVDSLGVPLARAAWRIGTPARRTLARLGQVMAAEFQRVGLPTPTLEPWVVDNRPEDAVIIDMAHTLGTTRMSADAKAGVVDADCAVHGVAGLYVAGGSVFPTSGHANPTLMILALAIRLADRLKITLDPRR